MLMQAFENAAAVLQIWPVGALCRAVADALEARFNPVAVRGEVSGFARAASGHCYFSIKDATGQIRCAMFRRAASQLDFVPRDGELVELRGRLGVYEARGDLQLIVESLQRAGQGALFEQFLRLKARLDSEGLFDAARKRPLPLLPRAVGVVTSLGAAALHDVVSALQRRAPHIPVVVVPAAVQGLAAPQELVQALRSLYRLATADVAGDGSPPVDVILLVRGGGAMEDLWAFNDEQLVRTLAQSPVPVVCGVGHETDFTLADFVADVRAPTPTAAAELAASPQEVWLGALALLEGRLMEASQRALDAQNQRLDVAAARLGRPSARIGQQALLLARQAQRLRYAMLSKMERLKTGLGRLDADFPQKMAQEMRRREDRLERAGLRLQSVDPHLVLQRGYAWLSDRSGQPITRASATYPGQPVQAVLVDGTVDLTVALQHER
jgi:exodeoxyribonuclease VII large subunit